MSEPFYYGPWDIEKIQNDIKDLQEHGGGGAGLPYFFPPYLDNLKLETLTSDDPETWTEYTIYDFDLFQGYMASSIQVQIDPDTPSTYKVTFTLSENAHAFVDEEEIESPYTFSSEDSPTIYVYNTDDPDENSIYTSYSFGSPK